MIVRKAEIERQWQKIAALLFSSKALPLRFIFTGCTSACIQLGLLQALSHFGCNPVIANTAAFLVSAQANLLLSYLFTWRDRQPTAHVRRAIFRLWLAFHGSISGSALLNLVIFMPAHWIMPNLLASILGIIGAAVVNFIMMNRFIFRRHEDARRDFTAQKMNAGGLPSSLPPPAQTATLRRQPVVASLNSRTKTSMRKCNVR